MCAISFLAPLLPVQESTVLSGAGRSAEDRLPNLPYGRGQGFRHLLHELDADARLGFVWCRLPPGRAVPGLERFAVERRAA
jgi:hypothetical protein